MVHGPETPLPAETAAPHDLADLSMAAAAGLGLAVAALFLATVTLAGHIAGARDFISYWATGRQLAIHGNPYDRAAIAAIEHAAGLDPRSVLLMRNPPWALWLAWPLGYLNLRLAAALWSLLLLVCLAAAVPIARRIYGSPAGPVHWLAMAFTPALICLTMGQTSLLALLGLTLFLDYHARKPLAAGAALWLCLLKPHLFLPWAAALLVWMVFTRAWRVLAGAAAALAASSAAAALIAPHAWSGYFALMRSPSVENDFIPCLAAVTRLWFWPQSLWVQYLPAVLCSVWAMAYFWRRRFVWNWAKDGSLLILVALVSAPYCWLYDQCLAIPAILHGAYTARRRSLLTVLAILVLVADIQLCFEPVASPMWLWTAPAWLIWFLAAKHWPAKAA